ncbi:hypothetical protein PR202_gb22482 [Eleusine coracana subsp. coracana]|uniref:BRX domain-containing protein n=1 Tax=Eleusine coracana subsp. coracana TaxID=191504 RepID=A0AAV5FHS7_ELECO|nr:hypothetical protein PR202_gb22482 [Eleusine coracana subsp. coracana]
MLTCIACSKQQFAAGGPPLHDPPEDEDAVDAGVGVASTPGTRHAIKALTAQIKDMALKASGAYRHCKPCAGSSAAASRRHHPYHHRGGSGFGGSDAGSGSHRFHYAYRRAGSSAASTPRLRGGVAEFSSGDVTPSMSVRTDFPAGDDEDDEEMSSEGGDGKEDAKEWVAQVEPGVLITFISLAQGGNDLKRIRFSRYCNGHHHNHGHQCCDSVGLASTPKLSSISGAKTETSSIDASMRTSSSPEEIDRSGELSVSISNASDQEREWVEEDEPGVYITIRALPGGIRELRRVRFRYMITYTTLPSYSREKFSEMHARLWWEENRARIHEQYL